MGNQPYRAKRKVHIMKHFSRHSAAVAAAVLISLFARAAEMAIDSDGMAVVDGQRTFILGLYENPADDAVLKGAVDAGINLVRSASSKEALDRLHGAGSWAWLNTGGDIDFSQDAEAKRARLAQSVETLGGHPALLVWEVPDEALWNAWYQAETWRRSDEPKAQRDAIDALDDKALAAKLTADRAEVSRLFHYGLYAESEALADSIWTALGKDVPKPGFGLSTAPERAAKLGAGMLEGYRALRALDPAHPVWMNHAPRNTIEDLAYFNRGADIVGCDIYPVPMSQLAKHSDLADRTMTCVGAYTDRMQAAAPGKPVWMVLQGTGWGDFLTEDTDEERATLRRPSKEETRFMAYDAIVHGARGILYWGSHYVEKDSTFWMELLEVMKELDGLQPLLVAPDTLPAPSVTVGPTNGSVDRGVVARARQLPDGVWYILVNEWSGPLEVTLALPGSEDGQSCRVHGEDTVLPVAKGAVTLHMPGYSVAVLQPYGG